MNVILLETISHLGSVGEVVKVRPGYARNYLLPKNKAVLASDRNIRDTEHKKTILDHQMKKIREAAQASKNKIEKEGITILRKAGENEKLFGSVTSMDIAKALDELGVVVSRKTIKLDDPIKKLGSYEIPLKLDTGVDATVKINVEAKPEETV